MAKLKVEKAEKQEQAAMRLAEQKHETSMRKKDLEKQMEQMALQQLEEDYRQRVAAAKINESELIDNCLLFIHHSSELNLFKDRGSHRSLQLVQDWVISFLPVNSTLSVWFPLSSCFVHPALPRRSPVFLFSLTLFKSKLDAPSILLLTFAK